MSDVNAALEGATKALVATQQITSSPTADGRPALIENTALAPDLDSMKIGDGLLGEEDLWDGRYSIKNFVVQIIWRVVATSVFIPVAIASWNKGRDDAAFFSILIGIALLFVWSVLIYRIINAQFGHHYRLTNRRLFVSSGILRRLQYQLELTQVKDVTVQQTFFHRCMGLGNLVVAPIGQDLPVFHLPGVTEPSKVRDLIWQRARLEQKQSKTEADSV